MLPFEQALEKIGQRANVLDCETVELSSAVGRILAKKVSIDLAIPPFSKSLVDGYAIHLESESPAADTYQVIETIVAGTTPKKALKTGEAAKIMTGAPIPEGTGAVVMIEHVAVTEDRIKLDPQSVKPQQLILPHGTIAKPGQTAVEVGIRIGPQQIGIMAECGIARPSVFCKPEIAVLTTGDEVIPCDQVPGPSQIRNSNRPLILSLARNDAAKVLDCGHVGDEKNALQSAIAKGLEADMLVITGGVSMGDLDLIPSTLEALRVERVFHKINLKPGKPVWFGKSSNGCLVFGLPGNPVSSFVCYQLLVKHAVQILEGGHDFSDRHLEMELASDFHNRGDRLLFQPGRMDLQKSKVDSLPWKGSADQVTVAAANCLIRFEAKRRYEAGETVSVTVIE